MDNFGLQTLQGQPPAIPGHDPVRCLGAGTQGQVWLMSPHDGSAVVAAKCLSARSESVSSDIRGDPLRHNESQITQEWRVLTQFHHDHLIRVRRLVRDCTGALVLLMDYAAGGSLAQIVGARGPLNVGETVTVLTPIGQVLAFLHGRGAVHGDVSPGNVLLSAAGKPFLADFGFGRLLGQREGTLSGTPGYYCTADTVRDDAADVYALAAVGWFALTGRPAPATRDRMPLGTIVQNVPSELVAALEAGLNDDAALRPTAAAFAQAVFRSARAEAVALGNAVHPSVLPELLTRKDVKVRRTRKHASQRTLFGRRRTLWAEEGGRPGRRDRRALRHQGTSDGLRRWRQEKRAGRQARRLGGLWGNGPGTSSGSRRRRGVVAAAIAAAVAATVAAVLISLGFPDADGGWGPGLARGVAVDATAPAAHSNEPLEWAAALPAEIQKGLAAPEPAAALHALAWVRSYALSNADASLVARVNSPGSAALETDNAIVQSLKNLGHTLAGLETKISQGHTKYVNQTNPSGPLPPGPTVATVRATVTTSAFAELDAAGTLVHKQEVEQSQELDIVLVQDDSRWTIQQILEVAQD